MPFEDWAAHFTFVCLCPVGVAPIPVEEEAEEAPAEEDSKSDEEEDWLPRRVQRLFLVQLGRSSSPPIVRTTGAPR